MGVGYGDLEFVYHSSARWSDEKEVIEKNDSLYLKDFLIIKG